MTDRELLELAAKAAGIKHNPSLSAACRGERAFWNPLTDDGDALRLAVKLHLEIDHNHRLDDEMWVMASPNGLMAGPSVDIQSEDDRLAATRRAIVRAAAAIGKDL